MRKDQELKVKLRPKRLVAVAAGCLALTGPLIGCASAENAGEAELEACGGEVYREPSGASEINTWSAVGVAWTSIRKLHKYHLEFGESAELPIDIRSPKIIATTDRLTLSFHRENNEDKDEVYFPMKQGAPEISTGAILCLQGNNRVPNVLYATLQDRASQLPRSK